MRDIAGRGAAPHVSIQGRKHDPAERLGADIMKSMRILMIPVLWAAMALPAAAEKLSLGEISSYLNRLKTAQGAFTQVNEDGTISTGQILLKRPGRVRFEYAPPEEALVVADGDTVGIIDPRSNDGPVGYPLHRTQLKIILANNVDLTRERMVVGHASDGTSTTVRAQDPEHPEYSSIDLVLRATRWSCVNGSSMTAAAVRRRSFWAICRPACGCVTSSSRFPASDGCAWTRDPATVSEVDRNPLFLPIAVTDRLQPLAATAEFRGQVRVLCRLAAGLGLGQRALRGGG